MQANCHVKAFDKAVTMEHAGHAMPTAAPLAHGGLWCD